MKDPPTTGPRWPFGNWLVGSLLAVIVVAAAVFAWPNDSSPPDTIDGQAIGPVTDCVGLGLTPAHCERALAHARSALDVDHPGHAPIAQELLREDSTLVFVDGQWKKGTRSGKFVAMVEFGLTDGTRRVQIVACGLWQPGDPICDPSVP
jgi:hypothetical protein